MNARRSVLIQLVALGVAVAMSLVVWPFLPGRAPIHWDLRGRPDAWGSPAFMLLIEPVVMLTLLGATFATIRGRGVPPSGIYGALAFGSGLFVAQHGLALGSALLAGFFTFRVFLALMFGLFIGLAPVVARVDQNPWFGIRTSHTLGSRRVWRETHRLTGRFWTYGGAAGFVMALLGFPALPLVAYVLFLALWPAAIAYGVWKRLGR